jgi:cytochrome c
MKNKWASLILLVTYIQANLVLADACDLAAGEKIFSKCSACHSYDTSGKHALGPNLWRIIGRKAGSTANYPYSLVMEESNIVWTSKTLNSFLKSPMTNMPGTAMAFSGVKNDRQRQNLLCFLSVE